MGIINEVRIIEVSLVPICKSRNFEGQTIAMLANWGIHISKTLGNIKSNDRSQCSDVRYRLQMTLLIFRENFYSSWKHQKTIGFFQFQMFYLLVWEEYFLSMTLCDYSSANVKSKTIWFDNKPWHQSMFFKSAPSLVISDLRSENKGSRFQTSHYVLRWAVCSNRPEKI